MGNCSEVDFFHLRLNRFLYFSDLLDSSTEGREGISHSKVLNTNLYLEHHHGSSEEESIQEEQRVHQRQVGSGHEVWQVCPGLQADSQDPEEWKEQAGDHRQQHSTTEEV